MKLTHMHYAIDNPQMLCKRIADVGRLLYA